MFSMLSFLNTFSGKKLCRSTIYCQQSDKVIISNNSDNDKYWKENLV